MTIAHLLSIVLMFQGVMYFFAALVDGLATYKGSTTFILRVLALLLCAVNITSGILVWNL